MNEYHTSELLDNMSESECSDIDENGSEDKYMYDELYHNQSLNNNMTSDTDSEIDESHTEEEETGLTDNVRN